MVKERRTQENLPLKSIWETELVSNLLREKNASPKHAYKIWNYLIQHSDTSVVDLPFDKWMCAKRASDVLKKDFTLFTTKVIQKEVSERKDTTKLIVELQDGHRVETVVIQHRGHATVCVSSQVGCQMGCKFCATGTMGIIGDLTAGEIIEQVIYANVITKIRNVVFMGMGEPLNNWENVKKSVEFLIDSRTLGLSSRHVTVSTVGVVHNMKRLTTELPTINLALSLHAPNQDIRLKIVPAAKAHKFEKVMDALDYHIENCKSKSRKMVLRASTVMIEYILIKDINDRPEHAHELGKLLGPRRANILLNLIPYNPTDVAEDFYPPSQDDINTFYDIITSEDYGVYCRVRQEMGQDIDGACGQLALKSKAEKAQEAQEKLDIEELSNSKIKSAKAGKVVKLKEKNGSNSSTSASSSEITTSTQKWSLGKLFGGPLILFSLSCLWAYRRWTIRK